MEFKYKVGLVESIHGNIVRIENPSVKWAIIIDKKVLIDKECAFCIDNAASNSEISIPIQLKKNKQTFSVESAFQSSKVFEKGGPYRDILNMNSREAKRDDRLKIREP